MDLPKNHFVLIDIELRELDRYQDTIERYFKKNANKVSKQMDGLFEIKSKEEIPHQAYINTLTDDYRDFAVQFPNHFRASFLSQMCASLESNLKRLCIFH